MESQYLRKYRPSFRFSPKKLLGHRSLVITLLVGIPVFSFILFSPRGVIKRISLETEKSRLEGQLARAEAEQVSLLKQSRALDHDLSVIEKIAREQYGMIRPGETVYKVKKEK
ncbi:MAG TPA: septum formation initiator family protein [Bacteroidota bacterium]|nr:septum formation initiator family protein [Bacteroidota bacterium]